MTLLYSPVFHESKDYPLAASAYPDGALLTRLRISGKTATFSPGAGTPLGLCEGSRSAVLRHIFSAKEAHGIGMARGYSSLFSILSSLSPAKLTARFRYGSLVWLLALFAVSTFTPSARAQSASGWNKRGQAAELRQDYDAAYEAYLRAHQKNPKDMRFEERVARMRFQAGAQHVDRGRVLRQSGDVAGALNEFTRALQIDPSNDTAAQEIQITQHPQAQAQPPAGVSQSASGIPMPSGPAQMLREIGEVSSPIVLKPLSNDLITMHLGPSDAKDIYTAIGKASGLNVLFDPGYTSKRIPVDLNSISYTDALRIVGLLSGSFYKAVTPDTISS